MILHWIIPSITWVRSTLNFFMNLTWICSVIPKYLNFATLSSNYHPSWDVIFVCILFMGHEYVLSVVQPPHKNGDPNVIYNGGKWTTPRWAPRRREWQYVYHPMCKQSLPARPRAVWARLPASRTESATSPRCPPRRVLRHQHPTTRSGQKVQFPKRFLTKISFFFTVRGWCGATPTLVYSGLPVLLD